MPARKTTPKVGDIVAITFLDHCEGGDGDGVEFKVFGRVMEINKCVIQVGSWIYNPPIKRGDGNESRFDILRSTILSTRILR